MSGSLFGSVGVLVALAVQNSFLALAVRLSRIQPGEQYDSSVMVAVTEIVKLVVSVVSPPKKSRQNLKWDRIRSPHRSAR